MQSTERPTYRPLVPRVVEVARTADASPDVELVATTIAEPRGYLIAKRTLDIVGAAVLLVIAAPILAVAAIAILLSSGRPVLFAQDRIGKGGVPFACWKLRTMVPQAEDLLEVDAALSAAYTDNFKIHRDPRITRVGRILRATSVDELPQLWNVLRGEMSLVGPRPVTPAEYVSKYGYAGRVVFSVRPGLTGLWQVSGRSAIAYPERIALDLEYVAARSFTQDLRILLLTPVAIIRGGM